LTGVKVAPIQFLKKSVVATYRVFKRIQVVDVSGSCNRDVAVERTWMYLQ
jgi:hypothetical protein